MPIEFNPPLASFDPNVVGAFNQVPASAGVYIVGVKIAVDGLEDNGSHKFCPLYVGEADNLQKRIKAHWNHNSGYVNAKKELFDLKYPISSVYRDIKIWNTQYGIFKSHRSPLRLPLFRLTGIPTNGTLIYFRWNGFFDDYFGVPVSLYTGNGHKHALADLRRICMLHPDLIIQSNCLVSRIIETKRIISTQFYFAFHEAIGSTQPYREEVEAATKCAMERIELYTYGDIHFKSAGLDFYSFRHFPVANVDRGEILPIVISPLPVYDIDFSNIQNDLVNLTGTPFETPLIISV